MFEKFQQSVGYRADFNTNRFLQCHVTALEGSVACFSDVNFFKKPQWPHASRFGGLNPIPQSYVYVELPHFSAQVSFLLPVLDSFRSP